MWTARPGPSGAASHRMLRLRRLRNITTVFPSCCMALLLWVSLLPLQMETGRRMRQTARARVRPTSRRCAHPVSCTSWYRAGAVVNAPRDSSFHSAPSPATMSSHSDAERLVSNAAAEAGPGNVHDLNEVSLALPCLAMPCRIGAPRVRLVSSVLVLVAGPWRTCHCLLRRAGARDRGT